MPTIGLAYWNPVTSKRAPPEEGAVQRNQTVAESDGNALGSPGS
jgi:hypothetical protein